MEPISTPLVRNRSHRSENIWANTNSQPLVLQLSQTHTYNKNVDTAYMYGYLIVEKNLRNLTQIHRKMFLKQKCNAFWRIHQQSVSLRFEKNSNFALNAPILSRNKKASTKNTAPCVNPQLLTGSIAIICERTVQQKLENLNRLFVFMTQRRLLMGFISLISNQRPIRKEHQQQGGYDVEQITKINQNGSRNSNKRKVSKNMKGQEVKQNSNFNPSELSAENQRVRNQLLTEQLERQQFAQRMHELLDYHQKYLLQGSTTTRGKKQK